MAKRTAFCTLALAVAALGALAVASLSPATPSAAAQQPAGTPVENFGLLPDTTQAGAHPDLQIAFTLKNARDWKFEDGLESPCFCQNARFVTVRAPAGLLGSPSLIPKCSAAQFAALLCPVDSQVGLISPYLPLNPGAGITPTQPIFNMVPRAGEPGLLGYTPFGIPIFQTFEGRTESDYGLDSTVILWEGQDVRVANEVLWGTPALPEHDTLRFELGDLGRGFVCDGDRNSVQPMGFNPQVGNTNDHWDPDPFAPLSGPDSFVRFDCRETISGAPPVDTSSNSPEVPFISAPTKCSGVQPTTIDVVAFDGVTTHASAAYPATSGCDLLSFNPSLAAKPTTTEADSPSGLDVELTVPQPQSPETPSPSSIRATKTTLPEGFTINPSAADGKSACTDEQANFGTRLAAECPESAKIGSIEVESALFPGPLEGYLYLGQPLPGDRYRVFQAFGGFGTHIKLAGTVDPDDENGQVTFAFEDLPQAPFERFTLRVFGAERGSLATPEQCGAYPVRTEFTPWNDQLPTQSATQFFTIDSGPNGQPCPPDPRPFDPSFDAGSEGNTAGATSPFTVILSRDDGDQYLDSVDVTTPPGFSGILAGIPYCTEAAIAMAADPLYPGVEELRSPICPASQVGTATGGAGAGSRPVHQDGRVYLAGPYKGAPLSLAVVIPAVTGPYDVGNILTRVAIFVDPTTGQVSTVSDPLPRIIDGIPLRVRSIRVDIDREDFAINPTDCSPHSVDATLHGAQGAEAKRSNHYQVANCASLGFKPNLSIRLRGSGRRNAHPALQAVLRANPGEANISRSVVVFPPQTLLDQSNLVNICTRDQFASDSCPKGSIYGRAVAFSPLLAEPLRGPVYLRSNGGARTLPDLLFDLHGQVDFQVTAYVDSVRGGLRTIIPTVPDVPVSAFVLRMQGGARKGLVVNSTDLCRAPQSARVALFGHNGKRSFTRTKLAVRCAKKRKARRSHRRRAGVSVARKAG